MQDKASATEYVAGLISEARSERGFTQQEAADAAGLPLRTYVTYERGQLKEPAYSKTQAIAEALEIHELLPSSKVGMEVAPKEHEGGSLRSLLDDDSDVTVFADIDAPDGHMQPVPYPEGDPEMRFAVGLARVLMGKEPPRQMGLARMRSGAMEDTIARGDVVVWTPVQPGEDLGQDLYYILLDGRRHVRRLKPVGDGWDVICDNPSHDVQKLRPNGGPAYRYDLQGEGVSVDMHVGARVVHPSDRHGFSRRQVRDILQWSDRG